MAQGQKPSEGLGCSHCAELLGEDGKIPRRKIIILKSPPLPGPRMRSPG